MSINFNALEGFIKLPQNLTEQQFYNELNEWIIQRGGEFFREPFELTGKLEIQKATHFAVFNKNKDSRYTLRIEWDPNKKRVAILMMNPSDATALYSDPTVKFMIQYVKRHFNAGSVWIINMSPKIKSNSEEVDASYFTHNKENESLIEQAINWSNIAFLAWGDKGGYGVKSMGKWFENLVRSKEDKLFCFRQSNAGNPIHRNQRPKIPLDWEPQMVDLDKIF